MEKEPIFIDALTFGDINNFVQAKFRGQKCSFCGTSEHPSPIGNNGNIVFTKFIGTDADGAEDYGSIPLIPLLCETCGHVTQLSPSILINELEKSRQ